MFLEVGEFRAPRQSMKEIYPRLPVAWIDFDVGQLLDDEYFSIGFLLGPCLGSFVEHLKMLRLLSSSIDSV